MLIPIALLYVIIPVVQFVLFLMELPFFRIFDTINYFFAIVSYYWIFNHILITIKIPFMQRYFPYDKLVKFHVITGTSLIVAMVYHVLYKIFAGKMIDLLSWGMLILFAGLFTLAILWIEAPLFRHFRRKVLRRTKQNRIARYEILKMIHGYLFAVMGVLSFIHILRADMLASSYLFAAIYPIIHLIMVLGLFIFSKLRKLWLPHFSLLSNTLVQDTSILTFKPSVSRLSYSAGQFGYISWRSPGLPKQEHPFSFLSAPSDPSISLGIKGLGDYTDSISSIPPGSIARINGGFGNFIPDYHKGKVCLIGSGIGIVPIVSLVRDMITRPPLHKVEPVPKQQP
jgi:predicted ferric reductase